MRAHYSMTLPTITPPSEYAVDRDHPALLDGRRSSGLLALKITLSYPIVLVGGGLMLAIALVLATILVNWMDYDVYRFSGIWLLAAYSGGENATGSSLPSSYESEKACVRPRWDCWCGRWFPIA